MTHTWRVRAQASSLKHEFLFQTCRDRFSEGCDKKRTRFSHISCTNRVICLEVESYIKKAREPRICWAGITNKMAAFKTIRFESFVRRKAAKKTLFQKKLRSSRWVNSIFYDPGIVSIIK